MGISRHYGAMVPEPQSARATQPLLTAELSVRIVGHDAPLQRRHDGEVIPSADSGVNHAQQFSSKSTCTLLPRMKKRALKHESFIRGHFFYQLIGYHKSAILKALKVLIFKDQTYGHRYHLLHPHLRLL